MQKLLIVDKPTGLTPLQVIKQIKLRKPELASFLMSYAGRLDPLAHGVLLIMVGEEVRHREKYLILPKEYIFELVLGLQTDTYDMLGFVKEVKLKHTDKNVNIFVNTFVKKMIGKHLQSYPPYSSKPVNGKPLFWWAKNNKLNEIEIPKKEIEIFDFICEEIGAINTSELKRKVMKAVAQVEGDFRQKEILKKWDEFFKTTESKTLTKIILKVNCSSGTYVRALVNKLGGELGCGAVTVDIKRTRVGEFTLKNALKL